MTTTKLMLNMMWAIRIVWMPERVDHVLTGTKAYWFVAMNRVSSDDPSTISGVDIGRKISRFVAPRPRNR